MARNHPRVAVMTSLKQLAQTVWMKTSNFLYKIKYRSSRWSIDRDNVVSVSFPRIPWNVLCSRKSANKYLCIHLLMSTLTPQSNGSLYSNTVFGTLAVDRWAVTSGTARRGLGGLRSRPVPSSLYQTWQPTDQLPVYQLHIIRCSTIIAGAH